MRWRLWLSLANRCCAKIAPNEPPPITMQSKGCAFALLIASSRPLQTKRSRRSREKLVTGEVRGVGMDLLLASASRDVGAWAALRSGSRPAGKSGRGGGVALMPASSLTARAHWLALHADCVVERTPAGREPASWMRAGAGGAAAGDEGGPLRPI